MELAVLPSLHRDQEYLESLALRIKSLRLRSLLTDPDAFSSTYESESKQANDFWVKRLQNLSAKHFTIIQPSSVDESSGTGVDLLQGEWLAILVLLGPQAVDPNTFDNASSWKVCLNRNRSLNNVEISDERTASAYHIVGVWVAPEARKKGLAKQLIGGAVQAIKSDLHRKGTSAAICTIGVADTALIAQRTYRACGFSPVASDCYHTEDGRYFRDSIMRQDIVIDSEAS